MINVIYRALQCLTLIDFFVFLLNTSQCQERTNHRHIYNHLNGPLEHTKVDIASSLIVEVF